ncbi:MAG: HAD-IIB family hydrolase [Woeseiaceae bacterium]
MTGEQLIVFSDLDGSLLDHNTYDWQPAQPALDELKRREFPLVLVSSKTISELENYRAELNLQHPVVAENGAAMLVPDDYFSKADLYIPGAVPRSELQSIYTAIKQAHDFNCEAFFELGLSGIMRQTGLTEEQASRADDRMASEPILWLDSEARMQQFEREASAKGLACLKGGRFLHLTGRSSKEAAVRQLLEAYALEWPDRKIISVSLGDGPNDLGMLATTDIAVLIPGKHKHPMSLSTDNRVLRPEIAGPGGWNEAMLTILKEL